MENNNKTVYAFIDASNLFYGGEKSLGWKIDYQKLFNYLKQKYSVTRILYFGGVEIYNYEFDYLKHNSVNIDDLKEYFRSLPVYQSKIENVGGLETVERLINILNFYLKLKQFGYELYLKPIKRFAQKDNTMVSKANCDVDMTFYLMKEKSNFDKVIVLSGDGDFLPVLKYLREINKEVVILARGPKTAKEIRQFAKDDFRDFEYLKHSLERRDEIK